MDSQENTQVVRVSKIGKYDVIDVLGRGGMGVVYRGFNKQLELDVAIKTLTLGTLGDAGMLTRFYDEGRRTARLNHPNIIKVYDLGDDNGTPYIVMEYLEGAPLDKVLRSENQPSLADKLGILEEICEALGYAHRNNVIHRDVKPANIFVQPDGSAKLLDFGIARLEKMDQDSRLTRTGHLIGTVQYMSPERLRDETLDGRSDIFAAGVVLFQMLTGQMPFSGSTDTVIMQKILNEPHPSVRSLNSECPASLEMVIDRALAKSVDDRYPMAEEMAADLRAIITELRQEQVKELMPEAQRLVEAGEFARARGVLHQLQKIDSTNTEARLLLSKIQQHFTQKQKEDKIQQLRQQAEDALHNNQFDQAISGLDGSTELVQANPELIKLREQAIREKEKQDRINDYLRQAEAARRKGDYHAATTAANKALKIDKTNSRITSLCTILSQEAEQAQRQSKAKALLDSVRGELGSRRYNEAIELLKKVEELDPTNPEIPLLVGDANSGLEQAKRKEMIAVLEEEVNQATTHDHILKCAADIKDAMVEMPTEAALFKLNSQVERKLKEHENRILVEETIQSCRSLRPREALDLVRKARRQLPAEERLLSLEGMLAERCRQQSVDERRDDYLSKAREALKDGQYSEAVSALELCEAEGIATGEILSLLEFARTEEADHRRQDQFRRNLAHAQGLIGEFSYDEAIEFLEGAIHQNDDTALHLLLDQATTSRDALRQQIDAVLASVASLLQAGRHGEAIQILETQPPAVLHAARAQATLTALVEERQQALYRMAGRAYAGLEIDPRIGEIILQRASSAAPGSAFFQSISESFHARGQVFADRVVSEAIRKSKELGRNQAALLQLVKETAVCAQFASPVVQAEWRRIEKKAARPGSTALFAR